MQSREYPDEITFACNNGKQMWTRSLVEVLWFASHEEVAAAATQAMEKCGQQRWAAKADWLVLEEPKVKERLATLQPTA